MKSSTKNLVLTLILLALAAVSPNLFPAAQAGLASFQQLILQFLLPSIGLIILIIMISKALRLNDITRLAINGIVVGLLSTIVLEIFRETGFRIGFMPGDLPRLMGVIMLNQFATGPDIRSDLAGWVYHFWNGAAFGLIFSLLLGAPKTWEGLFYGLLIAAGFMISPVVKSLGIGAFGVDFKNGYQFASTVIVAHISFGLTLSYFLKKFNRGLKPLWKRSIQSLHSAEKFIPEKLIPENCN